MVVEADLVGGELRIGTEGSIIGRLGEFDAVAGGQCLTLCGEVGSGLCEVDDAEIGKAAFAFEDDEVFLEDVDICESVQRGLKSRAYQAGRLSARREAGEHLFHRLLHADLKDGVGD